MQADTRRASREKTIENQPERKHSVGDYAQPNKLCWMPGSSSFSLYTKEWTQALGDPRSAPQIRSIMID